MDHPSPEGAVYYVNSHIYCVCNFKKSHAVCVSSAYSVVTHARAFHKWQALFSHELVACGLAFIANKARMIYNTQRHHGESLFWQGLYKCKAFCGWQLACWFW